MRHPYQCLLYCCRPDQADAGILVAASGPYIHTFSFLHGKHLSSWRLKQDSVYASWEMKGAKVNVANFKERDPPGQEASSRPQKRRKLSSSRDDSGSSAEIVVDSGGANGQDPIKKPLVSSPIIKLAGSSDGRHVVAVTGEDKCIRVFKLLNSGALVQLSER